MSDGCVVGGCLCGAVRFSAAFPTLFCAHCHCAWCRRAHGAAFVTWFGVPAAAFSITRGSDRIVWFRSSPQSERGFCGVCGSTLLFRSSLAPGEMHVALACADGPIDRAPSVHIFDEARVPWITLGDDLRRASRDDEGLAKYQAIPCSPTG